MIQDSPEDYHSNTGALIIGNPKVRGLPPLSGARKEAERVARLVGVPSLLEEEATKQAVLERISWRIFVNHASVFVNIRATSEKFVHINSTLGRSRAGRKHFLPGVKKGFAKGKVLKWMLFY